MTNEDPDTANIKSNQKRKKGNWGKSYVVNNTKRKRELGQKSFIEPKKAAWCRVPNNGGRETEHADRRKISN